ncbi:HTH domain-containing protein [Lacisediminihabitans sp. H27-G8]|uniref:HTH domain-containing protein n=1 Tax=Lacisediminihabitans sp. H27-G8 TaxID=3111909 RepID=UPI0038FD00A2
MTVEAQNPAAELRRLIAEGHLSEDALQAITGIQPDALLRSLAETQTGMMRVTTEPPSPSNDETSRLAILAAQLTVGLQIGDDDRLKGIFESLTIECHLTLQNIARLVGLDVEDVEKALHDPRTVPIERKYELATRGSFLINAVNLARGR